MLELVLDGLCSLLLLVGIVVVGSFSCQASSWMLIPYCSHPWEILWIEEKASSAKPAAWRKTKQAGREAGSINVVKYV